MAGTHKSSSGRKARAQATNLYSTLHTVLFFSFCMLAVPVSLFWVSFEGYLDPVFRHTIGIPTPDKRSMVSGVLAVFGVNFIVAAFIFCAFKEDTGLDNKKQQ